MTRQNKTIRNERERKEKKTDEILMPEKRLKMNPQLSDKEATKPFLKELWENVGDSVEKLFVVFERQDKPNKPADWHSAQIDLNELNNAQARQIGELHVRCWVRHFQDAKKRLTRSCRHWPLIRKIKPDGDFGDIMMLEPSKVEECLQKSHALKADGAKTK